MKILLTAGLAKAALAFCCVALLSACHEEEVAVEVTELQPAPIRLAVGARIAVLPFQGAGGAYLARILREDLQARGYQVLPERLMANAIAGNFYTPMQIAALRRWLDADVFIEASLDRVEAKVNHTWHPADDGVSINYHRAIAFELQGRLRIHDAHGTLLGELNLDGSNDSVAAGDVRVLGPARDGDEFFATVFPPLDWAAVLEPGLEGLAHQFRCATTPGYKSTAVTLFNARGSAASHHALQLARAGLWEAAAKAYKNALQNPEPYMLDPKAAIKVRYNLAVSQLYSGEGEASRANLRHVHESSSNARLRDLAAEMLQRSSRMATAQDQAQAHGWSMGGA